MQFYVQTVAIVSENIGEYRPRKSTSARLVAATGFGSMEVGTCPSVGDGISWFPMCLLVGLPPGLGCTPGGPAEAPRRW